MTPRNAWIGFIAMSIGMFMAILDIQIVASSLPEIQAGMRIPRHALNWVQTSYLIAEVIAIMLTGCLTPVLSTGGLFTTAITGFTLASVGCALSPSWQVLILCRTIEGFCGGAIIPSVFSVGYKLFPVSLQPRATLVAGSLAVLAPTLGPCLGGFITACFDWPWLFLVNVVPGLIVALVVGSLIRVDRPDLRALRKIDGYGALSLSMMLASIELLLSRAPEQGWSSAEALTYIVAIPLLGVIGIRRCRTRSNPLIDLGLFADRRFSVACGLSFVFGAGLYGSVYLVPLFLGFVRGHDAFETGIIMTTMGAAQLITAPLAAVADERWPSSRVALVWMTLFAAGLISNGFETPTTDANDLFWPQALRGCGVLLVILPLTRVALAMQPTQRLADASALVNLSRNLGGAIGIAVVDTLSTERAPALANALASRLQNGDREAARFAGLPLERFHGTPIGPTSAADREFVRPLIDHAAATIAFNEAWVLLGLVMAISLLLIPWLRPRRMTHPPDLL